MGKVLTSTDSNFTRDTTSGLVLVDFWAEWCGPCQMMLPRLEQLAEKMTNLFNLSITKAHNE